MWVPCFGMALCSWLSFVDRQVLTILAPTIIRDTGLTAQKLEEIDRAIDDYRTLKLKVAITELDVTLAGAGGGQLGGGRGAAPASPPTPEALQRQSDAYTKLFAIFVKHRDVIDRVTFWGVADADSWLNNWPIKRRTNYPLLFDRSGQPKPAFYSVINTVNSEKETRRGHRGHYDN